ncbi:SURF6-domain-containing protein [Aspergillus campestris IBT 28561]|uniref:SURF6-domain-containing protein n=1 Tax=Aspergillus campestris (strain IBT 28561) TaxID=1392248 RepID=A0A2I1D2P9_ASPC2|nr:SURF6-domain-containing protein [Aspergillus campestris IBT 28561]PKY04151.1 SURF6-domain-containing protein [Aspergillus campestris IBT 28561]
MDDIEDRLRSHAQAFDGLLSLIPAKYYYGDDGSQDQWQRKKQTKEEAREAKRAKLDPASSKTAKDIMDENARKRKREEKDGAQSDDASEGPEDLGSEAPKEGLKRGDVKQKKQKQTADASKSNEDAEARKKMREEKKEQKKASQKEKKKAKVEAKKSTQPARKEQETATKPEAKPSKQESKAGASDDNDDDDAENEAAAEGFSLEFNAEQTENPSSVSSTPNSPGFDASNVHSGSSSISSIVPPTAPTDASNAESKPLKATPEELKQRLQKRLDELRAARHADGFDGKPARNRQELIEARRQKAEERKEHKKELRQKAKEELQRKNDEAIAKRFSPGGSGSLLASPRSPADSVGSNSNSYSFGRVMFADGQHTDPTLSNIRDERKRQVVQDPAAALKTAESKKARFDSLDAEKRAELEEKDMWLNAKKRAHGERVRDDTSLLKKALKRKESAKKKSEREWQERLDAVRKGKDMKQSKREENLRKRRDGKGGGDKKGKKKAPSRPGFEGSFKTKVGGKKK